MAVPEQIPIKSHTGNGVTTVFAFDFLVLAESDLLVLVDGAEISAAMYAIAGVGVDSGGTVTFTTAPASGALVILSRDSVISRVTDYQSNGDLLAAVINRDFDRLWLVLQEMVEGGKLSGRSLRAPVGETVPEIPDRTARANTFLAFDSSGDPTVSVPVSGSAADVLIQIASTATAGLGDALVGVLNTATGGIARTQHARNEEDVRSTDFSTLQAAATAAATAGVPLRVIGNYAMGSTKLTLPVGFSDLILEGGATLTWTGKPAAAAGTFEGGTVYAGIECLGDNVTFSGNGRIIGPSTATYVANEAAIFRAGASSASRGIGLTIRGRVRVSNWGAYGVLTAFCDGITLEGDYKISGVGYGGALLSSASMVRVRGGEIGNITPGTIGNAYGLTLSHNSTGYVGGGKAATQPFCWDVVIDGLTVYDVPLWQGIDAHGAYEVSITNCKTYNCKFGIAVSGGSGAAANYAGYNNQVIGNTITVNKRDGSATTVATDFRLGINISGGATSLHDGIVCAQNTIDGYGDTTPSGASISAQYVRNAQIVNNTIKNWTGRGIYTAYGGGVCQGNIFDAVSSATNTTALYFDTTLDTWTITGNRHRPLSGTVAAEGLRFASGNPRCLVADNDLDTATVAYASFTGLNTLGASDTMPLISVTGTPTTISVAAAGRAPKVRVDLDTSGGSTVTTITGSFVGQRILVYAPTTNVTVIDKTQIALPTANWTSTQYDVLELLCVSTSASVRYVQVGAAANS